MEAKGFLCRVGKAPSRIRPIAAKALASALLVGGLVPGCAQIRAYRGKTVVEVRAGEYTSQVGEKGESLPAKRGKSVAEREYRALKRYASAIKNKDRVAAEKAWAEAGRLHGMRGNPDEGCGICVRADALRGLILEERSAMDEYFMHMDNFEPEGAGEAHQRWTRAYFAIIAEGE
jgi:hypothetical protein